ncbi:MAG: alginate O-acetyltransferase AlgX-related protein, partial [Candidatus Binatia bacterium]
FYRMKRKWLPVSRYLRQYSVLYNLIGDSRAVVAQAPASSPNDDAPLIRRILERQTGKFEQRWRLTVKELDAALRASQAAQIELVMLYLPSRWEVYWESIKARNRLPDSLDIDRLRRTVVEYCGARKIACFDLTPVLKQAARQGKELYFPIDGHWNKEGNRLVAEAVKNFLTAKGLTR